MLRMAFVVGCIAVAAVPCTAQERPERRLLLDELNWIEIGRMVPDSAPTVLLGAGIVEPHGVVNNGADNTVPYELAVRLAPGLDALVAPNISYGVVGSLAEYPGTIGVSEAALEAYSYDVLRALAQTGFRNIIVLNGHGPNGVPLRAAARRVFEETSARLLVVEWWTLTADLVQEIYGTEGGHAGNNETGAVMAVRPDLVRRELYSGPDMATASGQGWTAFPFPSSIILYREGEGYPDFDRAKADRFMDGVVERLDTLIRDVIGKWDAQGL